MHNLFNYGWVHSRPGLGCGVLPHTKLNHKKTRYLNFGTGMRVRYWVPQKLPQIYTVIVYICIGKVALFSVYICGNI